MTVTEPTDVAPDATPDATLDAAVAQEAPAAPETAPKNPRSRKLLGSVLRWAAAVVVCGGLGAGTAAAITSMERTDVPGLATENDGRWAYPKLSLPPLPEGSPRPFTIGNEGEVHHADLRALLLPAPAGATVDPKLDGVWVSVDQYVSLYSKDERPELKQAFDDSALRHITARAWTMPDGTKSAVYLLRFKSVAFSEHFKDYAVHAGTAATTPLEGIQSVGTEALGNDARVPDTVQYATAEKEPYGPEQTRWAYIQAGDTLALVVQSRKGEAAPVPFQQTVTLQNQLLG
ncbi:hypothetical protein KV205_27805 [Streptomyces sp. SKN60]|uniref:hypothetical protein n=1 Tax=Streptomyces sp. SKN60 TaxID=2855506 RepID=UPI0022476DEF|nr:hypothetical protein [Streptomyces sp. SKN60]MCX2184306.1 hypothetical protein [Streptomyces sp. SKN60]